MPPHVIGAESGGRISCEWITLSSCSELFESLSSSSSSENIAMSPKICEYGPRGLLSGLLFWFVFCSLLWAAFNIDDADGRRNNEPPVCNRVMFRSSRNAERLWVRLQCFSLCKLWSISSKQRSDWTRLLPLLKLSLPWVTIAPRRLLEWPLPRISNRESECDFRSAFIGQELRRCKSLSENGLCTWTIAERDAVLAVRNGSLFFTTWSVSDKWESLLCACGVDDNRVVWSCACLVNAWRSKLLSLLFPVAVLGFEPIDSPPPRNRRGSALEEPLLEWTFSASSWCWWSICSTKLIPLSDESCLDWGRGSLLFGLAPRDCCWLWDSRWFRDTNESWRKSLMSFCFELCFIFVDARDGSSA